jgi:DNA polymerase III epsilon subunit-like protein
LSWHLGPRCGFDVESTGVDPETDRIVTAALVIVGADPEPEAATWLLNPGVEMSDEVVAIHKISNERVRAEGVDPADALDEISAILADQVITYGIPLVAMNARFDFTMLDRELRRHGQRTLLDRLGALAPVIDPFVLDKQVDRYRKGHRTLTDLAKHYGVTLDDAHEASADALAGAQIAAAIAERNPHVQGDAMELHARQVKWAKAQALGLASYFRRTPGKESRADEVRTEWPMVPFAATEGVSS